MAKASPVSCLFLIEYKISISLKGKSERLILMSNKRTDFNILKQEHFKSAWPLSYDYAWISQAKGKLAVLQDDLFGIDTENNSWSIEIEEIHEEPTKNGWIDVYEREQVIRTISDIIGNGHKTIIEFGASVGYMVSEMKDLFPSNSYISTDLMNEGLIQSYKRNPDIMHIRCDFTDAPFKDNSTDLIYSLNVLEHIDDDQKTISECYRILKPGGYCLFVVPRGDKLYDYFDEILFHKRRYAHKELNDKCVSTGFQVINNFHFAWLCYPAFWIKKKWNRHVGKKLSQEEKLERVKADINNAITSPLAINMMHFEHLLSKIIHPPFGVRECILCMKE